MNPADGDVSAVMIKMIALGRYGQGDEEEHFDKTFNING